MPSGDPPLTKRYALKLALIYLLIRSIPDLLLYVVSSLPEATLTSLTQHHGAWLRHLYPVVPLPLDHVPWAFQLTLALLPVLVIETLWVFLFSALFLQRRPETAQSSNKDRWVVFILAVVIWSWAIRHQLLDYVQAGAMNELRVLQNDPNWLQELPALLMREHWRLTFLLYATTPLWAWLPVCLHFRFAKTSGGSADAPVPASVKPAGMAIPLQRATVFASFMFGCLALHIAVVQGVYMGLWPWAAELSQLPIPMDDLSQGGLSLALSQVVFATLACALAAYVYVSRLVIKTPSTVRLVVKPWLAGVAAYLLTCFIFLALVWLALWLKPELFVSFLQWISEAPGAEVVLFVLLGLGSLALLGIISGRLRESPRLWSAVLAGLMLCAVPPLYVGWTLASSNMGIAGGEPGFGVTGELGHARWRNMEQWCTGVVETHHGTWLVGRYDDSGSTSYVPHGVPDLSELLLRNEHSSNRGGYRAFGSRPVLTTLSLLQDDGRFKLMATVPEVACLVVSPGSDTLFLFTGVQVDSASQAEPGQSAVFRSTDHGETWEWLESGFMAEVQRLAWNLKPSFASEHEVWAWGKEPPGEDTFAGGWPYREPTASRLASDGTELQATALFYSADQGKTSTVIYSPEPLIAPVSYLREIAGEPDADFSGRSDMHQERFVVQVSDDQAYAWVSEFMWYRVGEESHPLTLTTRAELWRTSPEKEWQVTQLTREPGLRIEHLSTSLDGRTYAILQDEDNEWLARLDTQKGEWIERQRTPSLLPGWLAEDRTATRYFWHNGDYQVVSLWGYIHVPRWLVPFSQERAEILIDAHFYTRDGGRNWHQLAIPDYLGVMGLSPHGSKLYWTKGNWYSNDEPLQWHYDLAK